MGHSMLWEFLSSILSFIRSLTKVEFYDPPLSLHVPGSLSHRLWFGIPFQKGLTSIGT